MSLPLPFSDLLLFRRLVREARIQIALGQGLGRPNGQISYRLAGLLQVDWEDGPQKGDQGGQIGVAKWGIGRINQREVQWWVEAIVKWIQDPDIREWKEKVGEPTVEVSI